MSNTEDLRATQYAQLCEDCRFYDRVIWQIPSFLVLICSAVVGVAYGAATEPLARALILLIGCSLALTMGLASVKHRFFQAKVLDALNELEGNSDSLVKVVRITEEGDPKNFLQKRSAGRWLIGGTFFVSLVLLALSVWNFVLAAIN
jgi:hypothetical protein